MVTGIFYMAWQLKMPPFRSKLRTIWLRSRLISQKMSKLENPLKANLLKPRFKISWKKCIMSNMPHNTCSLKKLLFLYCQQSTLKLLIEIFCQLLDSSCGLLISEATAPPTEPHPCPTLLIFFTSTNLSYQCDQMME